MTDYNRVVGEIRGFLQSADRTDQPRAAALAGEFAAACAEANDRLNRCAYFLRQGLRSEAIQLASTEPDLLDMVAVLDFPERAEWDELAIAYNWPRATALAIDSAQALNEAYAQEDPLADLLRVHRRLALARAPLAPRLDTMKKIARLDPENPIWVEDIRVFEQARHDQLKKEIPIARANQNAAALEAILHEVEEEDWSAPPPDSLVELARASVLQVRQQDTRKALGDLLGALHKANASSDPILGRKLRARWHKLIEGAAVPASDPLRAQAQGVLDWLDREDRRDRGENAYREALADLEDALDRGATQAELAAREEAVLGSGRGMPRELQDRLKERYRALERSARLRNRLILAGVGAATLALIGLVVWANARQARAHEIEQAATSIETHLDGEKIDQAREVLEHLESVYPGASKSGALTTVVNRLGAIERREQERSERFAKAISEAGAAPLTDADVPALANARKLARLESEKGQVEELAAKHKAVLDHERAEVDRKLRPRLEAFRARIGQAETLAKQEPDGKEIGEILSSMRVESPELKEEASHASADLRGEATVWIKRLEAIEAAHASALERARRLDAMIQAAGTVRSADDVKRLLDLVTQFATAYPDDPLGQSLRKLFDEQVLWQSVVAWGAMVQRWTNLAPGESKERLAQLVQYRAANPKYPAPEVFEGYRRHLDALARLATRADDDPPAQLRRLVSNPLVEDVWRVKTQNGTTHYALKEPTKQAKGYLVLGLVSNDCRQKPVFIQDANFEAIDTAPQTRLARRIKTSLTRANATPALWDATLVGILQEILAQPELDPVLRVILLKGTIQVATSGSAPLGEALKDQARAIDEARLNLNVAWVDPEDQAAEQERRRARGVLDRFPSLAPCVKMADQARQRIQADLARTYWPVGLLLKDPDGTWRCRSAEPIPTGTEFFVVVPSGTWKKIGKGTGTDGEVAAEPGAPEFLEGRLVFTARRAG